jgi:hypothetical protein
MLRLTVSQSVSMSWCQVHSGTCDQILFCLKVAVLSLWGALSDERSGLSPVSHCQQYLVHCQRFNIIYIVFILFILLFYVYAIYTSLCQPRLSTADHATTSVPYATTAV